MNVTIIGDHDNADNILSTQKPRGSPEMAEGHFSLRGGCGHNGMVPERGEQWKL